MTNINPEILKWIFIGGWFVFFIFLVYIELTTVQLVSIWFALGALVACVLASFNLNIAVQAISFVVVSLVLLVLTRPLIRKFNKKVVSPIGVEGLIGERVIVTKTIGQDSLGQIKSKYETYDAYSKDNNLIESGSYARIIEIRGNKVIVEKV